MDESFNRWSPWIRWLLLLPGVAVIYPLVWIVVSLLGKVMSFISPEGFGQNFFDYLMGPGLAAYVGIHWVRGISPIAKGAIALFVSCIGCLTFGFIAATALSNSTWSVVIAMGCSTFGCASAYFGDENPFEKSTQ